MPKVQFTYALKRFYPDLREMIVSTGTVADILKMVDQKYPGLRDYLVDEKGRLRKHVNVFIGNELIRDRDVLADVVDIEDEIFIMQALSGG